MTKLNHYYKTMLASPGGDPFDSSEWLFEIKWDGYRAIAECKKGKVELYSRNGISFNKKYESIAGALTKIKHEAVLDGEIVFLDKKGRASFQQLQQYQENPEGQLLYYV